MAHLFISYSTQNRDYALRLAEQLRSEGFDVWIDNRRLQAAEDWWRSIVLALRSCGAVVVVLTPEADRSRWVQREITLAEKYEKAMFPLLLAGDLNTPNWELFVRTQVTDVRDGSLPSEEFLAALAVYAERQDRRGADVRASQPMMAVSAEEEAELAEEIANPPDETQTLSEPPRRQDRQEKRQGRSRIRMVAGALLLGVIGVVAVVVFLVSPAGGQQQLATETAGALATHTPGVDSPGSGGTSVGQVDTAVPTQTPTETATPSETPTHTPTVSQADFDLTVQAEMGLILTEGVQATAAQATNEAATAVFQEAGTAEAQTATATHWTPVPTADARQTAFARLTETQAAAIATATRWAVQTQTQAARDATATATLWTDTPTPTNTPTFTPTPTPTAIGGGTGEIAFSSERDGDWTSYLMDTEGGNVRPIPSDTGDQFLLSWSPDGQQITFQSDRDGDLEIFTLEISTGSLRQLTRNSGTDQRPVWSPDGREIVFYANRGGTNAIYVIDADGENERQLTFSDASDIRPAWSPDGRQIVFQSDRSGNADIYVMDADGSNVLRLTNNAAGDYDPAWSPDGQQIVFGTDRDGNEDIYVMDAEGSNMRRLTNSAGDDSRPVWSPDGTQIAFQSDRDGDFEIYVMDTDGSNVRRLTNSAGDDVAPKWRPVVVGVDVLENVPTSTPGAATLSGRILGTERVNVRSGPGTGFAIRYSIEPGTTITLVGRNSGSTWVQLNGGGWVSRSLVSVSGSVTSLPVTG